MSAERNAIYQFQSKLAENRLKELEAFISKQGEKYYVRLQRSGDYDLEIFMGSRRFLLEYSVDVKVDKTIFVTSHIMRNESNYGNYKQVLLSDLSFEIDQDNNLFFRQLPLMLEDDLKLTESHNFAAEYFGKLEALFVLV